MARRTGLPSLLGLAQNMCRLIVKFTPIIQQLYGTNATLLAALAVANAACADLVVEISAQLPTGD